MNSLMNDSLVEKVVGGVLISRRYVSGNSLGRDGTAHEGRQLIFNFRLEPSLTQNLTVSELDGHWNGLKSVFLEQTASKICCSG